MTTITDTKQPCDISTTCLHAACRGCEVRMRHSRQLQADHPGTRAHKTDGLCSRGVYRQKNNLSIETGKPITPPDWLSDADMAYLRAHYPHAYNYHSDRRKRGIPKDGLKRAKARL